MGNGSFGRAGGARHLFFCRTNPHLWRRRIGVHKRGVRGVINVGGFRVRFCFDLTQLITFTTIVVCGPTPSIVPTFVVRTILHPICPGGASFVVDFLPIEICAVVLGLTPYPCDQQYVTLNQREPGLHPGN